MKEEHEDTMAWRKLKEDVEKIPKPDSPTILLGVFYLLFGFVATFSGFLVVAFSVFHLLAVFESKDSGLVEHLKLNVFVSGLCLAMLLATPYGKYCLNVLDVTRTHLIIWKIIIYTTGILSLIGLIVYVGINQAT